MTTARPSIPATNLKERIAALEQRNAEKGAARPTSPTPGGVGANGFRDKIAKFEKKGGVPVPRGSFGLGAPPASDGPRRRGELYGNRIPAPARAVSVGGSILPSTRASSPTDTLGVVSPGASPTFGAGDRRSFSLSSVISDGDTLDDYTPISSPTFAFPLESPESVISAANHLEATLTSSPVEDVPGSNRLHILRGTSFQKALEIAKTAETAKLEANEPRQQSHDNEEVEANPLPAIVVSSEDAVPPAMHDSSTVDPLRPLPPVPAVSTTTQPEIKGSDNAITNKKDVNNPRVREEGAVPVIPVNPLIVRKRRPTNPTPPKVEGMAPEPAPPVPFIAAPTVVVHEPPPASTVIQADSHSQKAASMAPAPEVLPEVIPQGQDDTVPTPTLAAVIKTPDSIPQIVLHEEVVKSSAEPTPHKTDLSLNSELIDDHSLTSPSLETGDTSVVSLTGMLGNYFASKDANGDPIARPATPPSRPPASPLSPYATLAYDGPETPDKPTKPTIEVPDPQSFLSPPPSGFRSALSSGGGSSISSMGSRPMSMIETSPGNVSRAMRMTPATSRGVPMFLPPTSAHPRKSDFVYFPPTPEAAEFGSATLHKSSQSLSLGSTHRASDMVINDPSARLNTTFTAVVHGKVRETPTTATLPASFKQQRRMPETPQMKRVQRMTMMEPPASPASGELAALLQEAVLLEDSLDRGELPTEANVRLEAEEKEKKEREAAAAAKARARASKAAEDEERQRIAAAGERLKAKRDEPTSGRLKHTFLVPLSKARSAQRKEAPTPQLEVFPSQQADPFIRPKSAGLPEKSSIHTSQDSQVQRPVTPENKNSAQYLETPPKSSRFASFRRLGSVTARPNTIHGHSNRYSVSTSSEDSAPVITPPDTHLEFGSSKHPTVGEFGQMPANGSTTSFPTLSPKKSSTSIGRAASFAERVFSRSRKQSNVSILSATSEMTVSTIDRIPEDAPSLPVLSIGPLPSTSLPPISDTPAIVVPISETETKVLHPPKRSTSLARSSRLPPLPTEMVPPLPTITPSAFFFTTADAGDVSFNSLRTPHATADDVRPTSWTSMSSAGSLPSPLFDTSLFDAFPSVPEMTPALSATASLHRAPSRSIDPTISYDRPSFDSDLLSSAIHLASTHKSTAPVLAPASNVSRFSRSASSASRRSQENTRF